MGVWIVPPTSPLLLPEFIGFPAIGEAGDPRSSAVKLHGYEGGVRDAMQVRGRRHCPFPTSTRWSPAATCVTSHGDDRELKERLGRIRQRRKRVGKVLVTLSKPWWPSWGLPRTHRPAALCGR